MRALAITPGAPEGASCEEEDAQVLKAAQTATSHAAEAGFSLAGGACACRGATAPQPRRGHARSVTPWSGAASAGQVPLTSLCADVSGGIEVLTSEQLAAALTEATGRLVGRSVSELQMMPRGRALVGRVAAAAGRAMRADAPSPAVAAFEDCVDLVWLSGGPTLTVPVGEDQLRLLTWSRFLVHRLPPLP